MKRNTILPLLACLALASVSFAERQPFDRYQSIVDRQMFGALPPGFDPTKMPSEVSKADQKQLTKEQEKLQSSIHFSVINVTPDGATAVGFTDNSDPKTPVHYYLKVGECRNGWEVKEADATAATMTIAKGDIEVSLSLGGNSAKGAGSTTRSVELDAASANSARGSASRLSSGLLGGGSLLSRRRMREKLAQEEKEKADAAAAEREAERQAQAEAEKARQEEERAEMNKKLQELTESIKRSREREAKTTEKQEGEAASGSEQNDET